jgi:hypothetical protein
MFIEEFARMEIYDPAGSNMENNSELGLKDFKIIGLYSIRDERFFNPERMELL